MNPAPGVMPALSGVTCQACLVASRRSSGASPRAETFAAESGDACKARAPLILVVDDHDDIRELYAEALREAGYRVDVAADGSEALARIASWKPAVVLMDLSMPRLDGWEATRRIKENDVTADVLVVAVTAHATRLGIAQIDDFGADEILSKPCLPADVVRHVTAILAQRCHVVAEVRECNGAPVGFRRCQRTPSFRVGMVPICEHHYETALDDEDRRLAARIDRALLH